VRVVRSPSRPISTTTPTAGAPPVITVQFKPYGVKLDFTPTITPQGAINLKVAPEVSSLDFTNSVTLQGFTSPSLAQRRAKPKVLPRWRELRNCGLIDQQVIETMDKVPGLAISILGKLFAAAAPTNRMTSCWC